MIKLKVENLSVSYGAINAVRGVSFEVNEGEIVALIGANGAGKTTILRTITGLERAKGGSIFFKGKEIIRQKAYITAQKGIAHVPEGRRIFTELSVYDNLMMAAQRRKEGVKESLENVYDIFPRLKERRTQPAGTLSGGEQQMLAVGRALMTTSSLVLLDEPSMGLAPIVVNEIFAVIRRINEQGRTVLLVEQNAQMALATAHRAYVLETGKVTKSGDAKKLLADPSIKEAYLGC